MGTLICKQLPESLISGEGYPTKYRNNYVSITTCRLADYRIGSTNSTAMNLQAFDCKDAIDFQLPQSDTLLKAATITNATAGTVRHFDGLSTAHCGS
jgi:hypothetical protein